MPGAGNSYLFGAHGMTIWFFENENRNESGIEYLG
jgi:hypothetical protein